MKSNSILKEKMNRLSKIIISVLLVILLASVALNIALYTQNCENADKTHQNINSSQIESSKDTANILK